MFQMVLAAFVCGDEKKVLAGAISTILPFSIKITCSASRSACVRLWLVMTIEVPDLRAAMICASINRWIQIQMRCWLIQKQKVWLANAKLTLAFVLAA